MSEILPFVIGALFWAWLTQASTRGRYGIHPQAPANYIPYIMLLVTLTLPIVLRTSYNDTRSYMNSFYRAATLPELLASGKLQLLGNPLFSIYESLVKTFTGNHIYFFLFQAIFVQYSYVRFIRRHCENFLFGIYLYICLGTHIFSFAAMKQVTAMAVLLYAVEHLIERKYYRFYLTVFIAILFHTYAICFLLLPLFTIKPWTPRTFVMLFSIFFVILNFNSVIGAFLDFANDSGKYISESEVLGTAAINPLRVAVYAVTPLFALFFRKYLFLGRGDREHYILINMSVITVSIMSLGLVNAANMFARMGQYFEFGLICSLPWMIEKPFERNSMRLIYLLAIAGFAGFFAFANLVQVVFNDAYDRYTLLEAVEYLLTTP